MERSNRKRPLVMCNNLNQPVMWNNLNSNRFKSSLVDSVLFWGYFFLFDNLILWKPYNFIGQPNDKVHNPYPVSHLSNPFN